MSSRAAGRPSAMATIVLIPGAGSDPWYWHLVAPLLRERGHEVVAVDLPWSDDSAGLDDYATAVAAAVGDRSDIIVVAQSMGAFVAPLVCGRMAVSLLVLVAPMVPRPGETAGDWWANTGQEHAMREQAERDGRHDDDGDLFALFMHDVPPEVAAEAMTRDRGPSATPFGQPWPLHSWPDVPTKVLLCRGDRLFPADFMRRVVRDRLGIEAEEMDGGHLPALSRPVELAERLHALVRDQEGRTAARPSASA